MRYLLFILCFVALSCSKDEVVLTPEQQLAHDIEVIDTYIASKNTQNVIEDPSGLRYVIHTLGDGPLADLSSHLKVSYQGAILPSEDVIDASLEPPTYFFFTLEEIIEGWQIAFQHLPQGSTATLYLPSALAYGPSGNGPVPPNSPLIFLVEFVDFYNEGPVADVDANSYTNKLTADQLWLTTSLTTSKYDNGETIDPLHWSNYNDDALLAAEHGKLYSYAAVSDPRKLCPAGYKIPSKNDWLRLSTIMEAEHSNAIELTPGGSKESDGTYSGESMKGVFWASDDVEGTTDALTFVYFNGVNSLSSNTVSPDVHASVRCIKGF